VGWRNDQFETAGFAVELPSCLARGVGGVIVEQKADRRSHRIACVKVLEKIDELARAMLLHDAMMHDTADQIDGGRQSHRAEPFVFVVALNRGVLGWPRWQVRCGRGDCLDARLLVLGSFRHRPGQPQVVMPPSSPCATGTNRWRKRR